MKRSDLEALGLSDEQITGVMKLKSSLISENENKIETLEKEKKELEVQVSDLKNNITQRDNDIKELKNSKDTISKEKYEELENKYKDLEKTSKENLENVKKGFLIDKMLGDSKAKNTEVLKKQLDMEKVILNDGKLTGLEEQIEALKESDAYLFDIEDTEPVEVSAGGSHDKPVKNDSFDFNFNHIREKKD